MRVVYGSDFLVQQEARLRQEAAEWRRPQPAPKGFWARVSAWLTGASALERQARRAKAQQAETEADDWARGRYGEDSLADALAACLDDQWMLLRNYTPPPPWNNGGDIDAVLLGPHGVTVFEAKAWSGLYRVSGAEWEWRPFYNAEWEPAFGSPSKQAMQNARRVRELLAANGLKWVPVRPAVAMAGDEMRLEIVPPLAVYIFFVERGYDSLAPLLRTGSERLSTQVLGRVYAALVRMGVGPKSNVGRRT